MENLYQLMNERIKRCETDERDYLSLFRKYFFCEIVPNLMDRTINNIDLTLPIPAVILPDSFLYLQNIISINKTLNYK